jgi:hypothetical protein
VVQALPPPPPQLEPEATQIPPAQQAPAPVQVSFAQQGPPAAPHATKVPFTQTWPPLPAPPVGMQTFAVPSKQPPPAQVLLAQGGA